MKRTIFIVSVVWITLVGLSFWWNEISSKKEQEAIAFQTARSFFTQIVITREWNAGHGGVYVAATSKTPPNPHLEVPLKNIEINQDLTLTLINPAYMTRQLAEIAETREGIHFHITSLRPIRPENEASPREKRALESFEQGTKEVGEFVHRGSTTSFFYMAPLITEKGCLKCHAHQGYKEGDIRGGISIIFPHVKGIPVKPLVIAHAGIGIAGLLIINIFGIKLDRSYKRIERQAAIDVLTGIPNRRSFSERMLEEFNRSRRDKYPLSVLMCDIDHFKSYNDTYGHQAGDKCLERVAQVIEKETRRPGDFCARYGGEEFIVILPNTNQGGALQVAERIRENVQGMNIPHQESSPVPSVTISAGVATTDEHTLSPEELLNHADQSLYRAKERGRNRVEVSKRPEI